MSVNTKGRDDEGDGPLSREEIEAEISYFRSINETSFVEANIRNVLFCGASRSGKTTAYRVMMDPCYCPTSSSMFAETRDTVFKSFSLRNNTNQEVHEFIVNMIDSPGTFEIQAIDSETASRSNEEISQLIVDCLNHEVTYLNMVALFLNIGGTVGDRDIESIDLFMQMFGNSGLPIYLIVTHADQGNNLVRENISNQLTRHPGLYKYFEAKELKLLFMGCVDYIHRDFYSIREVRSLYRRVMEWRSLILGELFKAENKIELSTTHIYKMRQIEVSAALKECIANLEYFLCTTASETGDYKLRQETNKQKMYYLYSNKMLLQSATEPEVLEDTEKFWGLLQQIKQHPSFTYEQKCVLVSPWAVEEKRNK